MKRTFKIASAALLTSAMALSAAYADSSKEEIVKPGHKMEKSMGGEHSAKELAPGKMEKSGNVDAAKEAAPGQMMNYTSGTTGRPKGVRRPIGNESPEEGSQANVVLLQLFGIGSQKVT